jgi:hypothetical protein
MSQEAPNETPKKPVKWGLVIPWAIALVLGIRYIGDVLRSPTPVKEPPKTEVIPVSFHETKPEQKTVYVPVYVEPQTQTPYSTEPKPVDVKTGAVTNGSVIVGNNNRVTIYGGREARRSESLDQEVTHEVPVVRPFFVRPTTPGCDEALKKHNAKVTAWRSGHL